MKISLIKELPIDIQLLIYKYVEQKIIKKFIDMTNDNVYYKLNELIIEYRLINNYILLEKIKGALRHTYKLKCLKTLI